MTRKEGGKMRRKDRLIPDAEALTILKEGEYGILSTVSPDDEPYGVPLNYCLIADCIFFHCALEGNKTDNISNNPNVSFCVVGKTEILPDQFSTRFESCIVRGRAFESFAEEKQMALEGIVDKYAGGFAAQGLEAIEKLTDITRVFRITIESISGKAQK